MVNSISRENCKDVTSATQRLKNNSLNKQLRCQSAVRWTCDRSPFVASVFCQRL